MGSQNSEIDNDQFRKAEWQERNKCPQFQVWRSRSQPYQRLEQYDVCTQNDDQLKYQKKAFEIRKRNPLLVASYYFQSYPQDNFCSSVNRHSLFIERIPIRLQDVEHVPYPDYLHLFDAALKGFAQLARWVGFFPVEEGMVGINEKGVAKAWLNEDLATSRPFGRATEAQMVASLIEAIDRNIDHEQLPPSTPTVRNFLYRNADALTFDTAIHEFGEFVHNFNSGQVPIKLECIDEVGGVYTIANRDKTNSSLKKSNVGRSQVKLSQVNASSTMRSNIPQIVLAPPHVNTQIRAPPAYAPVPVPVPVSAPVQVQVPAQQNGQVYYASQPIQNKPPQFFQIPVQARLNTQPIFIASNKQITPAFVPNVANAPKFTVEVTPGKVYPQKNSTIFMNGSSKVIPTEYSGSKQVSLLDKIHPRFATSQKQVQGITEMPIGSLKIFEDSATVHQSTPKSHKDIVIENNTINATLPVPTPAPDSKRSITEVVIPEEAVYQQPQEQTTQAALGYNFMQFKDTVSVPQQSNSDSLAVSFNPAFEDDNFVNHSRQSAPYGQYHYQVPECDNIRQTGKFVQNLEEVPRRLVQVNGSAEREDLGENDLIRETGKFNINQRSGQDKWRYQNYDLYGQSYNLFGEGGQYSKGEHYQLSGRGDFNYQQFGSTFTEEPQIDLSPHHPSEPHAHYGSSLNNGG